MDFLIIDDDSQLLELFKIFSRKWQITWTQALTGENAIELVKKKKFDLILLDFKLLGMDGVEVFRQIKKTNNKVPIIILSGFLSNLVIDMISDIASVAFIKKPTLLTQEFFEYLFSLFPVQKKV